MRNLRRSGDCVGQSAAKNLGRTLTLPRGMPQARSAGMHVRAQALTACIAGLAILCVAPVVRADELNVAVAANFLSTLKKLAPLFEKAHGQKILPSPGSSGQLYAQIKNGAPYDLLLSADADRPAKLEAEGLAVKGSRFTYAVGRLVLWSPKPGVVDDTGAPLTRTDLRFVALADPKTAPYGSAAEEVLSSMNLLAPLRAANKLVYGESVGQALQFASSGHADCGFVALSQVLEENGKPRGSLWVIPAARYKRLDQDAVVLSKSARPELAKKFLHWLRTDSAAIQTISAAGYALSKR